MAGEAEMLPVRADTRIEVRNIVCPGLAEIHTLAAEAERRQRAFKELQRPSFTRRHTLAAHQGTREFDHVGDGGNQCVGHGRTLHPPPPKEKGAGWPKPAPESM